VLEKIHFFQSEIEAPGLFDSFFGGVFLIKGLPIFVQLGLVTLLGFGFFWGHRSKTLSAITAFASLLFASALLFQPWDELFIYLKHSKNLADHGTFSFNLIHRVDGIVDFLPFFCLGLLHRIGLPLLETNFFMGILGAWLCVLAFRRFLTEWKLPFASTYGYLIPLLYPPLLLNSGTGFSVLIFSALILWSLFWIVYRPQNFWGPVLLSIVPLVRFEGLFLFVLVFLYRWFNGDNLVSWTKRFFFLVICLLPTLILIIWKYNYYGRIIPIPILYKASFGNFFYSLLGLRNLFMDLVATGTLFFMFVFLKASEKSPEKLIFWVLASFCLPYYFSGGDWFPPSWGRYLFPFAFFCFGLTIKLLFENAQSFTRPSIRVVFSSLFLFLIILFPFSSAQRVVEGLLTHRTTLSGIHQKKWGKVNFRTQLLSQLGNHLGQSTPRNAAIGSSELATIMYFANREPLDLLGVTNIEIASLPLRTAPNFGERFQRKNELPYLIFKRLNPDLIFKERPYIFYAFDFIPRDLIEVSYYEPIQKTDLKRALRIWDNKFRYLNLTLFGGLEKLVSRDYEPVLVKRGRDFFSLYFVNTKNREDHFSYLKKLGFSYELL